MARSFLGAASLAASLPGQNQIPRPEIFMVEDLSFAASLAPAHVQDSSFPESYLDELRAGVLNVTGRHHRMGPARRYRFTQAFDGAYTFFFTAAGEDHLARASEVLGLPLGRFLERSFDGLCNAFFLNAVVLEAGMHGAPAPWHDFSLRVHADQSLRVWAPEVPLPDDGTARTVAILYLGDSVVGGEIEVYDHYISAEVIHRQAETRAKRRCRGLHRALCEARIADRTIANITRARIRPKKGRLVRFGGARSHSVRRVYGGDGLGGDGFRVAMVLEQFLYPLDVVARIPSIWSEHRGHPFFANAALREQFVDVSGRPRLFGMAKRRPHGSASG